MTALTKHRHNSSRNKQKTKGQIKLFLAVLKACPTSSDSGHHVLNSTVITRFCQHMQALIVKFVLNDIVATASHHKE